MLFAIGDYGFWLRLQPAYKTLTVPESEQLTMVGVVATALSQNGASLLPKLVAEHLTIAEVFPLHSP